jgi:CheY-like chemotaxis protein
MADSTRIHQVLMNLCTNAGHAMRKTGGVLMVGLEDVRFDERDVNRHVDVTPGHYLKIHVEDTGYGIPKEIREKIFEPFFTTKESGEGTGMGLAVVHGIIKELGGTVTVYSETGQGTAFHVYIPIIEGKTEDGNVLGNNILVGGTERILFVDDETIQVDLAKQALGFVGYQVTAFSDSLSALRHFENNPQAFDMVITDMTMPRLTGDLLVQEIHKIRPDIPVIMCTGFSEKIDAARAKDINIRAFLKKPVIISELIQTIRKIFEDNRTGI